jgi:hypothetical protein
LEPEECRLSRRIKVTLPAEIAFAYVSPAEATYVSILKETATFGKFGQVLTKDDEASSMTIYNTCEGNSSGAMM